MRIPGTSGKTLLHLAARRNLAGLCRCLLRLGADVNRTDILDRTALHDAAARGAAEVARVLISYGADLDAKDWKGRVPLDLADPRQSKAAAAIQEEISLRHARSVKWVRLQRNTERNGI